MKQKEKIVSSNQMLEERAKRSQLGRAAFHFSNRSNCEFDVHLFAPAPHEIRFVRAFLSVPVVDVDGNDSERILFGLCTTKVRQYFRNYH